MRLNRLLFSRRVSVGVNVGWEFPGRRPALRPRSGERTMMCPGDACGGWRRVSLSLSAVAAPASSGRYVAASMVSSSTVSEEPV